MTRLKNRIHSVLHAHLIPPYQGSLFSKHGRTWLEALPLAEDQRRVILRHAGELDRLSAELADLDKSLAEKALGDPQVRRLMTITGVNATVAMSVLAAIGDIKCFSSPRKLVSYFGLNPQVRQSGDRPAYHGRISKQGRAHARSMLVEAAWVISGVPGPLRAFFMRIRSKRGKSVAAVATARKLAVIVWHMLSKDEDYTWNRQRDIRPGVAGSRKGQPQPTATRQCVRRSGRWSARPRKRIGGLWSPGNSDHRKGARVPPMRCDDPKLRGRIATSRPALRSGSPEPINYSRTSPANPLPGGPSTLRALAIQAAPGAYRQALTYFTHTLSG
jgi:hypothetical protein